MQRPFVLVVDFGSQTTQLVARRVREAHVYCEIQPCTLPIAELRALAPDAIILSGGPASVFDEGSPHVDRSVFELGVPVLGICYGMQLMAHLLGGKVAKSAEREFGPATVTVAENEGILHGFEVGSADTMWMSHGDRVESLPPGFRALAATPSTPCAVAGDPDRKFYGVQFHPEVVHSARGAEILRGFLFNVAGLAPTFTAGSFAEDAVARIKAKIGTGRAICGLSGGVDSSVAATLVARAIGDRLTCVLVDNGLLREGEAAEVVNTFRDQMHLDVVSVDARDMFVSALAGVTDPETKRKTIGRLFIDVFDSEAKRIAEDGRGAFDWLVQGTVYPDVIESVSFKGPSAVIKSHHNVGGLPDRMRLGLVEPLRELFKDEVREVGLSLGIPRDILWRQPFPGPGMAIRCLGEVTEVRLKALRAAERIIDQEVRKAGLYEKLWQAFGVLLPVKSVGVMGDSRTYEEALVLRAVESVDGMTADYAKLPYELLSAISSRVINEVPGINRVTYDISPKPPATIEWE